MILQTHRKFYHKSIHNAAKHGDEVKSVPGILKVALKAVNVGKERNRNTTQHADIMHREGCKQSKTKIITKI